MFFHLKLHRNLVVHPKELGPNLKSKLLQQLHKEVEGTCSARYGFVITVTEIVNVGKGQIQPGTGHVIFPVEYTVIVFRPFKGEILDGVVIEIAKTGFFVQVGPLKMLVSKANMPADMRLDPHSSPMSYVSADETVRITEGDEVRTKILGTRVDEHEIFAVATIKEDYLGLIS